MIIPKELEKYIYFYTNNGILLNADTKEIFDKLPKKFFDLLILDPNFDLWNDFLDLNYNQILKENSYILTFSRQPIISKILNKN